MQKIAILNQYGSQSVSVCISFYPVQDESHEEIIERLDLKRMKNTIPAKPGK
jgi:hypothetical protein